MMQSVKNNRHVISRLLLLSEYDVNSFTFKNSMLSKQFIVTKRTAVALIMANASS